MKLSLTNNGIDVLLHCMEGGPSPVFTAIVMGNGENAGSDATGMSNPMQTIAIRTIEREPEDAEYVTLTGVLNNADVTERFRATEIGVMAKNEEEGTDNLLFAYGWVPDDEAAVIPAAADYAFETTEKVLVYVGKTEDVTAILAESTQMATKFELNQHVEDHLNPHQVTAEQVGLGNVPNVSTDGQTPTIDAIDPSYKDDQLPNNEIQNGNTLHEILSKVARVVHSVILHIANKSNPHGVTATQISAANRYHTHSTTDITSGVLSVARGGTGTSSLSDLRRALEYGTTSPLESGTYTGNGTYGSSNRRYIYYSQKPKLLIVMPTASTNAETDNGFIALADCTTIYTGGITNDIHDETTGLSFYWGSGYVSWFSTASAARQQNTSGKLYRYLIIY